MKSLIISEIIKMNQEICLHVKNLLNNKIYVYADSISQHNISKIKQKFCANISYICAEENLNYSCEKIPSIGFNDFVQIKDKSNITVIVAKETDSFEEFWRFEWAHVPPENIININHLQYYSNIINEFDFYDTIINKKIIGGDRNKIKHKQSIINTILENLDNCLLVYNLLEEELSRKIYIRLIIKKLLDCPFYFDVYTKNQYFDKSIVKLSEDEVFLDVGAYDGDTIQSFILETHNKYNHIYAFEPSFDEYCKLFQRMNEIENITCVNAGLYNSTELKKYKICEFGSSHLYGNFTWDTDQKQCILNLSIKGDELNLKPSFIKMDIEGAEIEALSGLHNTIRKYVPKLAISVYHKTEDFWTIPLIITKMSKEYNLFFRHHSHGVIESVCYAIRKKE